jgi:hypothetical protein
MTLVSIRRIFELEIELAEVRAELAQTLDRLDRAKDHRRA